MLTRLPLASWLIWVRLPSTSVTLESLSAAVVSELVKSRVGERVERLQVPAGAVEDVDLLSIVRGKGERAAAGLPAGKDTTLIVGHASLALRGCVTNLRGGDCLRHVGTEGRLRRWSELGGVLSLSSSHGLGRPQKKG